MIIINLLNVIFKIQMAPPYFISEKQISVKTFQSNIKLKISQ